MADLPDWTEEILGAVVISGPVTVSGSVSITGTVTISGTVNISGNVNVTVTSGTINVQTAGGANIMIDKLVQGAYTDTANSPGNYSGVSTGGYINAYYGKFFPRGCRGFVHAIAVYINNTAGAQKTVNFGVGAYPGCPELWTFSVVQAASTSGVVAALIGKFWNYDGMFIYRKDTDANVTILYDSTAPADLYISTDSGVTWANAYWSSGIVRRLGIYMLYSGQTVGDMPVSGTLNVVILPTESAKHGGLLLVADYGAYAGKDFSVVGSAILAGGGIGVLINQNVPAGETWYIKQFAGWGVQVAAVTNEPFAGVLSIAGTQYSVISDAYSRTVDFSKPLKATAGQALLVMGENFGAANSTIGASIIGYKG
jgi:hypothetical protein